MFVTKSLLNLENSYDFFLIFSLIKSLIIIIIIIIYLKLIKKPNQHHDIFKVQFYFNFLYYLFEFFQTMVFSQF